MTLSAILFLVVSCYLIGAGVCSYYAITFWGSGSGDGTDQVIAFFNFFFWPVLWPFLVLHVIIREALGQER